MKKTLKQEDTQRRKVFKSLLETPYTRSEWPIIDAEKSQELVELLCQLNGSISQQNQGLVIGFNKVNEILEAHVSANKLESPLRCLLVCRSDLAPIITAHLPQLCAASGVKLIALPRGTLPKLITNFGNAKAGVVGINESTKHTASILHAADTIHTETSSPWITNLSTWHEPNITIVETSAPVKRK